MNRGFAVGLVLGGGGLVPVSCGSRLVMSSGHGGPRPEGAAVRRCRHRYRSVCGQGCPHRP